MCGVGEVDFVVAALRFSVTLRKCVLANPVKIAFGTCQHCDCVLPKPQKKNTRRPISQKSQTKGHVGPLPTIRTPLFIQWLCFFYDFALFRSIFPYIYFACNSFPFIFTCKSAKYWYIFLLFCQRICLGFAGDCFWVLFFLL